MALGLASKSSVVWVYHPMGKRISKGLRAFTCLLSAPPKTTKVISLGPLIGERHPYINLLSVVLPLQYSRPAVGTPGWAGGLVLQAGTKTTGRVVVISKDAVTAYILMVMIFPVCVLNILYFILCLSRGNLFMGWAKIHCEVKVIAGSTMRAAIIILLWIFMKN